MKLYTEEQVRQMLSIYMANVLLDVDGKMPTIDDILSYRTPIELPSDEEIEEESPYIPNDSKIDYLSHQEGFIKGAKWIKEQIINQNK
jgi:hypothetical protein